MRIQALAIAGVLFGFSPPLVAQVVDTAAALQQLQREVESGRIGPEEIRARIRAAGLSDEEVRSRLRQFGYPETLLDQYLTGGVAMGAPTLTPSQVEQVLRRLSVPAIGEIGIADSLLLPLDSLLADTAALALEEIGLPIFGKSLFERATTQFRPVTAGPVPPNYMLGPGDELVLILTGDVQEIYSLPVTREGFVVIPNVGRVSVNGMTLEGLRSALYTYLGQVYSGVLRGPEATTFFDVSISALRSNQIFVIGEVERPAAYELSSVATALDALYQAGGPADRGSFRNVQVRRGGRVVATLDVYEYLTQGVATGDIQLDQGDVVFVPVRGTRVEIDGNIARPGIYELREDEGLRALIEIAGGVEPEADVRRIQIDRILPIEQRGPGRQRSLFDVNIAELRDSEGEPVPLETGDEIYVFAVAEERRNTVTVRGHVWSPGVFEFEPGMTVSDLIDKAGGLRDDAYLGRAQIIRLNPLDLSQRVVAVSLAGGDGPELEEYDEVVVYSVAEFRDRRFVTIHGAVQEPGVYEYRDEMTLRDLVMMAGGLRDDAYVLEAEVARIVEVPDATGDLTDVRSVPLDSTYVIAESVRNGGGGSDGGGAAPAAAPDYELERYDNVFIRRRPGWELQRVVQLTGEIRFPGTYALQRKDERLVELVERAGGLTPEAHAAGIRFYRRQEVSFQGEDTLSRVNVDYLQALENKDSRYNLVLFDGDSIHIPEFVPTVRVDGAVLYPLSVMYEPRAGLDYYIASAGGYARDADKARTRVEYANGSVRTVGKFLVFSSKPKPQPGSRVFVPVRPETKGIDWAAVTAVVTGIATVYALLLK
ncbi:MAG: SLBB domain-containing protein [Gemmatimonadota bacterium]|nr:MAG: SLBB domain-containing protein [Gemmatimonadota bacterium]